ncbi:MAG: hypothetical protein FJY10_04950 [Bacteroidetes bacterium]|nr:hypothetical protein [Bacteroidota bacterium]
MRKFVLFFIMLFEIMPEYGQVIEVIGDVQGRWDVDTVKVIGNIRVPAGDVLTIDPGVVVQFDRFYRLTVEGRLLAEGQQSDSIIFTIRDTANFSDFTSNRGAWNGMVFSNTGQQDSSIGI